MEIDLDVLEELLGACQLAVESKLFISEVCLLLDQLE